METSLDVADAGRGINEDGENLQRMAETYKISPFNAHIIARKTTWSLGVSRAKLDFKMA